MLDVTKYKLNWVPNPKDPNDPLYSEKFLVPDYPPSFDMRSTNWMSPIKDQGQLGSCVGHGVTEAMETIYRKNGRQPDFIGSPLYAYWNARWWSRSTATDSGAYVRYGMKGAVNWGVCADSLWPYIESKYAVKPTAQAYADGNTRDATSWYAIKAGDQASQVMHAVGKLQAPVPIGFTCFASLMSSQTTNTGIIDPPKANEQVIGGHCVPVIGYDTAKDWFIFKNSWTQGWGDGGYGYLRGEYLRDWNLADDISVLLAAE